MRLVLADTGNEYYVRNSLYYAFFHLLPLGSFFCRIDRSTFFGFLVLYFCRIFFVTAGYHCYFSHRAFRTSRLFQLGLAIGAQTSGQGSVLKWALAHYHHHANSDLPADLHSPAQHGFWQAHIGWLLRKKYTRLPERPLSHISHFPELRWLDKFHYLPWMMLAAAVYAWGGWPGLCFAYGLSTVLVFHATFTVNSLAHMYGSRPFATNDTSRNNWLVSLWMLGGGWHNNHHRYPASARQGFLWWQIDVTYYLLRCLAWLRLIWDIKEPPPSVLAASTGCMDAREEPGPRRAGGHNHG